MALHWIICIILNICIICTSSLNIRPIIGILSQDLIDPPLYGDSYIDGAYVKYLESAGAIVVPIRLNETRDYYDTLFSYINGVLFPGGDVNISQNGSSQFSIIGRLLYKMALQANDRGDYFPLWGTCLGFELMAEIAANNDHVISDCNAQDIPLPIILLDGAADIGIFHGMSTELLHAVQTENITAHFHHKCVTTKAYKINPKLNRFYKLLATGIDRDGVEFVANFQGNKYPFFGTQWHPEKNNFVFDIRRHIPHTSTAVELSQYMANFFVNQARKNTHQFPSTEAIDASLINNYEPHFLHRPTFNNFYYFNFTNTKYKSDELHK